VKLRVGLTTARREALGGGFVALRRDDGSSDVELPDMADYGVTAAMTSSSFDAREDAALRSFIDRRGYADPNALCQVNQVHGATLLPAEKILSERMDGDGLWTQAPGRVLAIRSADCAVLWLVDPSSQTLAMAHAGWQGVAAGIVAAAVRAVQRSAGDSGRVRVAIGPHLGPCCFEIGPEVAARFSRCADALAPGATLRVQRRRDDSVALDLSKVILADLAAVGVPKASVEVCRACTRCRGDLFHSYRRNGPGGPLMASLGFIAG